MFTDRETDSWRLGEKAQQKMEFLQLVKKIVATVFVFFVLTSSIVLSALLRKEFRTPMSYTLKNNTIEVVDSNKEVYTYRVDTVTQLVYSQVDNSSLFGSSTSLTLKDFLGSLEKNGYSNTKKP